MKKNTLIKWQAIIQQQSDSGLSVSKFCKTNRLGITCFYKYKKELHKSASSGSAYPVANNSFVKIQPNGVADNLRCVAITRVHFIIIHTQIIS